MGPTCLLTKEEDKTIVEWALAMQEWGLSITIQQFKLKVIEITQTKPAPFKDVVPRNSWWKWFQKRQPNISIRQIEGLKVLRAQGFIIDSYKSFYSNLATLYHQISNNKLCC
jgi:hypothetical protein